MPALMHQTSEDCARLVLRDGGDLELLVDGDRVGVVPFSRVDDAMLAGGGALEALARTVVALARDHTRLQPRPIVDWLETVRRAQYPAPRVRSRRSR